MDLDRNPNKRRVSVGETAGCVRLGPKIPELQKPVRLAHRSPECSHSDSDGFSCAFCGGDWARGVGWPTRTENGLLSKCDLVGPPKLIPMSVFFSFCELNQGRTRTGLGYLPNPNPNPNPETCSPWPEYRTSRAPCSFVCTVTQKSFGRSMGKVPRDHQPGFAADWTT